MTPTHRFLAVVLLCLLAPVARGDTPDPKLEELRKENQALKERIKELEKELRDTQSRRLFTIPTPNPDAKKAPFAIPSIPRLPEDNFNFSRVPSTQPSVPKNWRERDFNGMKYYIVPLQAHPAR